MELRQLKYFVKIKELKSFTNAANSLFISRQSLSKMISNLEDELGVVLFFRTSEGVELTEDGIFFYDKAKKIIQDCENLKSAMINRRSGAINLRIGFTYASFNIISKDAIKHFQDTYPDVHITISHYPDIICEQMVKSGQLDFACSSGPIPDSSLNTVFFSKSPLYVYMNKKHRLAELKILKINDLKEEQFYSVSNDFRVISDLIKDCKVHDFELKISYMTPDTSYIYEQVLKNKGIAFIPECLIPSIENPDFVYKKFPVNHYWNLFLVLSKNNQVSYYTIEFCKMVFNTNIS